MRLLFLEGDIDKALRRMALEEEKNLTETVNDILWKRIMTFSGSWCATTAERGK